MARNLAPQVPAVSVPAPPVAMDDAEMVNRIRLGDRAAFETLVRRYSSVLHRFIASRVDSASIAEDLVQDLLLKIWQNREQWEVRRNVRIYLYVAARNAAAIYRRHARIVERSEVDPARIGEAPPGMGSPGDAADVRVEQADTVMAVQRALARLPDRAQQAALLRLQHELSYAEIAETMGITVKAVERLMSRALKALRTALTAYM